MRRFGIILLLFFAIFSSAAESVNVKISGGSGKARIENPVSITRKDGKTFARLVWTSRNFDYMIVGGKKYMNENAGGKSTFTVQIPDGAKKVELTEDTTAMSRPHEIEYLIEFEE